MKKLFRKKRKKKESFKMVTFLRKKLSKNIQENMRLERAIKREQALCPHKYDDGRSAIISEALFHPAQRPQCDICGKEF